MSDRVTGKIKIELDGPKDLVRCLAKMGLAIERDDGLYRLPRDLSSVDLVLVNARFSEPGIDLWSENMTLEVEFEALEIDR